MLLKGLRWRFAKAVPREVSKMERSSDRNTVISKSRELVGRRLEGLSAILLKRSLPARLETRTKESNVHASMKVEKPSCKMKVIDAKLAASAD